MSVNESLRTTSHGKLRCFWLGLIISLATIFIISLIFGLILHFTSLSESYLSALSLLATILGLFLGSAIAAKIAGSKGLLLGISVAFAFLLINVLVSGLFGLPIISSLLFKKTIAYLLAGSLGGIFGVMQSK